MTLEQRQQASEDALKVVAARRLEVIKKAGGTFEKIAQELCSVAFSRIDDYVTVDEDGIVCTKTPEQIKKARNGKRKLGAVKKIKQRTTSTESKDGETTYVRCELEYELHDKMDALKYLVKLRGDEPAQKHEHTGNVIVETGIRRPGDE
ncbi:MAG: hypothetical protein A4E65_00785 [Syntrophorhabdus sp. PtaU1.Bin153]|nr:MAG: hypothetical protein A4E65_00785 [Syntrophorhabdus sp. PtaU1.Bin153]